MHIETRAEGNLDVDGPMTTVQCCGCMCYITARSQNFHNFLYLAINASSTAFSSRTKSRCQTRQCNVNHPASSCAASTALASAAQVGRNAGTSDQRTRRLPEKSIDTVGSCPYDHIRPENCHVGRDSIRFSIHAPRFDSRFDSYKGFLTLHEILIFHGFS